MSLSYSLRSLRRAPVFATAAALTLFLGIGSAASAFAIAHGVLIESLPYGDSDRLVSVGLDPRSGSERRMLQPPAVYLTYERHARRIAEIGFYRTGNANLTVGDGGADPQRVTAAWVTASTIPLLRVSPLLGRTFTGDEDHAGGPDVAVISESVWRSHFHAAPDVIGKMLMVNSVPREVVGVMPRGFMFPAADVRLWLPARLDRDATAMGDFAFAGVARLAAGALPQDAQRELAAVLPKLAESFPRLKSGASAASWFEQVKPTPVVVRLQQEVTHGVTRTIWMLAAAAGLVLLVALANVANRMLMRADARQLELAVREALGASRLRIVTHFLGESAVLAAVAGGAALVAAWAAVRALVTFGPTDLPRLAELHLGHETVLFVAATSAIAAIICTVVPTIRIRSTALSIGLRDGGRGETTGRARQGVRSVIAVFQIAVALVVLAGSALLLRTFQQLHQVRPGFDATNVLTVWTQLPFARYDDSASVAFYGSLTDAVARLPGVTAAGVTSRLPLGDGDGREISLRREDGRAVSVPVAAIGDDYFASLRIPVLAGAAFERVGVQRDGAILLSRRAAETLIPGVVTGGVIGRRLAMAPVGPTYTIVGVVGDVRDRDLSLPPSPTVYVPQAVPLEPTAVPAARHTMALVVRTTGPATAMLAPVRRIVHDLDPALPIFDVESMSDVVRASTARLTFTLAMMTAAAAITLALGAIGLYGVMAYMVALRTRELGIRIALGANPARLARSVALRGLSLVAMGVFGGFALYALATPLLRGFLYGVTPADPLTLGAAALALIATASLASWIPARRVARVDPTVALRAE